MTNDTIKPGSINTSDNIPDDSNSTEESFSSGMASRFRGYFPVVVDVETAGFNASTDALLEIACVPVTMTDDGLLHTLPALHAHIKPFAGAHLDPAALKFNGIDPFHPLRAAEDEEPALRQLFNTLRKLQKQHGCKRVILVGHNAAFDHGFLHAAIERHSLKNQSPFHPFSTLDTVSLGALAYGQTVLARCCTAAGLTFDHDEAHSALYDASITAKLFCTIMNRWQQLTTQQEAGAAQGAI